MISANARHGVNEIFVRSARTNLALGSSDTVDLSHLAENKLTEPPQNHLAVLTIASYRFRLLTLFHLDDNPASRNYFSRADQSRSVLDSFGETGNLCCGAMNRELGRHYPHLGMSTPYFLDRRCIHFIDALRPGYLSQYEIIINGSLTVHATLCLCIYGQMDFEIAPASPEETSAGCLEMF